MVYNIIMFHGFGSSFFLSALITPRPPLPSFPSSRHLELQRRKERSESHLYLTVEVYMDDDFVAHRGPDLVDFDDVKHTCVHCSSCSASKSTVVLSMTWGKNGGHITSVLC